MKNLVSLLIITGCLFITSCKDKESDRFRFLTDAIWEAESLLANGVDATGPDGILKNFVGDAKFNTDGTGTFGTYTGTWMFDSNETKLIITSTSLPIPITLNIIELTSTSLKVQGAIPDPQNLTGPFINIEMTFRAK
jgi:hypothetical protein